MSKWYLAVLLAWLAAPCVADSIEPMAVFSNEAPPTTNIEILKQQAKQGDRDAYFWLGYLYEAIDEGESVVFYQRAAAAGDPRAMYVLGLIHEFRVVDEINSADARQAVKWFTQAAQKGDVHSMHSLATLYYEGRKVPQNKPNAARWFKLAAGEGDACAAHSLADMYARGDGIEKSEKQAKNWYELAVLQGSAYSKRIALFGERTRFGDDENLGAICGDRARGALKRM